MPVVARCSHPNADHSLFHTATGTWHFTTFTQASSSTALRTRSDRCEYALLHSGTRLVCAHFLPVAAKSNRNVAAAAIASSEMETDTGIDRN